MVMPPSPQSSPERFCHPQGNQHPLAVTLYPTPLWTWKPPVYFLSLWTGQFWTPPASATLLKVGFHVWLLSLSMMLSRFFPAGAWISASFLLLVGQMSVVRMILPLLVLISQGHVCRSTALLGGLHVPGQTRPDPTHLCPYLCAKMLAFMGCLFL